MSKALVLFSGGLDSILAAKLLQKQGMEVICVHFISPFFGSERQVPVWESEYGLKVYAENIGEKFLDILLNGPENGYGKNLNPCVDCKILIFSEAKRLLAKLEADFLASGEVLGQRPMSQRRDTLNLIHNKAGVAGILLRPLSALLLEPTIPEKTGLVDRSRLLAISGRGRVPQLELAKIFGLTRIPAPAGGCQLTEKENTRRYWQLLKNPFARSKTELLEDFRIIGNGRALFHEDSGNWMVLGRNQGDNKRIAQLGGANDARLVLRNYPGPVGLCRNGAFWPETLLAEAAAILVSYSPRAMKDGKKVEVVCRSGNTEKIFVVFPERHAASWSVPSWEETHQELKLYRKELLEKRKHA